MEKEAEGGGTPLTVPDAAARVLLFTQVARAGDLPLVLNALSAAQLNAGIVRLGPRVPEAVIDHVIAHGPHSARRTLAWQLRLPAPGPPPVVRRVLPGTFGLVPEPHGLYGHEGMPYRDAARRRLLSFADPDLDRALFGRLEQVGVAWVRSAILRDRVGADGEAVVPPDLRAKLVDFLGTAVLPLSPSHLADTDTGDPEFELLRVLAGARDLGLSLPAARVLGLPGPIPAAEPGWRDQAWVRRWDRPGAGSRPWRLDWDEVLALAQDHASVAGESGRYLGQIAGLDEAAGREDIPEDVRRRLVAGYPQAAWHAARPDVVTLRRIAVAVAALHLDWDGFEQAPEFVAAIRDLIIRGLAAGSLSADEVIEYAVPAGVVLDLAWRGAEEILPAARGRADLAEGVRSLLYQRIGDDIPLWTAVLLRSFTWSGTVAELVDSTAVLGPEHVFADEDQLEELIEDVAEGEYRDVPSANVLMAFARPHVGLELLSEGPGQMNELELELLKGRPLPPGLVARALVANPGTDARRALAVNPVTPIAVLRRLLHEPVDPRNTRLTMLHDVADPGIRCAALELLEQSGTGWAQIMHFAKGLGEARIYQLVAGAPNAERLHFLLKKFARYLGPDTTALLYARLAAEAGPEPVWDVATAIGGVDHVEPFVRASMASGDAGPLLTAAEIAGHRVLPGVTVPDPAHPYDPHPDDPTSWPLETAVRQHLDNRPDRWRIMVHRLMEAGPLEYAQLVELVEKVGTVDDGVGEAVEGEP
ncbi:hypothetical protein KGQ19_38450 [Catenulispora sp. NL8]|uniref:Uncharacterized protein n=1 Tax=Catenulispora pinistramenti TaxID=2705254 RepID=A0ABS5L348_9ACTN|nr:hypothetical protein [Catenulispora pinistramenti]MBS2552753.1 hypothetical protein [Catenulispora pinistramenti]